MLFLRSESRLGLAAKHQTENAVSSAPCWGHLGIPKTFLCSSKGRCIRVLPPRGFSSRRESALQIVAHSYVTCGINPGADLPAVNLVPMKGERVPWLKSLRAFRRERAGPMLTVCC